MVTKATVPVLDLSLPIDVFNLRGAGASSIDGTPIGATTPSTGVFTNLTVSTGINLTGATITGLPVPIKNATIGLVVAPKVIINSSDGIPFINGSIINITVPAAITSVGLIGAGFTKLGDYVKLIIPAAVVGTAVANGDIVLATDSLQPYLNMSGVSINPTGTIAATLIANGFVALGPHVAKEFVINAAIGTPVGNTVIVLSSDGILMLNNSGGNITPSTGTATSANLFADGFIYLGTQVSGSTVTPAVIGVGVGANSIVVSSDGILMVNMSGLPITPTGITSAALIANGIITVGSVLGTISSGNFVVSAIIGVVVPTARQVVSSDGILMVNTTAGNLTPTTGTATAANLVTDGFVRAGQILKNEANSNHIISAKIGTVVLSGQSVVSSNGILMVNPTAGNLTPSTGTATANNLVIDGFYKTGVVIRDEINRHHVVSAKVGVAVMVDGIVTSSTGILMINHTNANITPTGISTATLTVDGLVPLGSLHHGTNLGGVILPATATYHNGIAVTQTLTSSNGVAPLQWSIITGILPTGISLNASTGVVSGTPTGIVGTTFAYTVKVVDANGNFNIHGYAGIILGNVIAGGSITPTALNLFSGQPSTTTLVAIGGVAPYVWSISGGTLPVGITLNSTTGVISGTPTNASGTIYSFTVSATDSNFNFITQLYGGTLQLFSPPSIYPNKTIFTYTGTDQTFTLPGTATWYKISAWGAAGGGNGGGVATPNPGGAGGYAQADIPSTGAATLLVIVGQGGAKKFHTFGGGNKPPSPTSYGGGGSGGGKFHGYSAAGGGLSGVFTDISFATATSLGALVVAAGGGGGRNAPGVAGGGILGGSGGISTGGGGGGTQNAGGASGVNTGLPLPSVPPTAGAQFLGGNGATVTSGAGGNSGTGAGGGFFGGGGGNHDGGGGGGGSSYTKSTAYGPVNTAGSYGPVNIGGIGSVPPNISDPDYIANVGVGAINAIGGPGMVIIEWN